MEGNLVLEHHPLSKMIRVYISSELTGKYWVINFNDLLLAHGGSTERTKITSCYLVFSFTLLYWFPGSALQVTRLCYSFFKQLCSDFHQKNGYCFKIFIRNKWTYGGNALLLDFQDARTMTFSNNMPFFRFTMGKNIPERTCAPPAEEVLPLSGYVLQCSGPLQWLPQECRVQWSDVSAWEPGHFTTCTWGSQVVSANVSWSYVCGKSHTDIMSLKIQMTQLI